MKGSIHMIKVIVNGCKGRMGQAIINAINQSDFFTLAAGIDKNIDGTEPYPAYNSLNSCPVAGDVVIDFSHYSGVEGVLDYCVDKKIPTVIATTALGEKEYLALKKAADSIPVFNSFNMSLGINAIAKLMESLVPLLEKDFNIEIIEKHHNKKKDSPSGTALLLADSINDACQEKKNYVFGRYGKEDDCKITDLGIHAIRGGTIPGEHTILFAGPDEVIEITHTALSRNIFANGALTAAQFIVDKPNGLYSMKNIV
jgi:4-hydroxy-tetrahydrodipicolinate reductase